MACRPGPFTSIFSNMGKVTPYDVEQNSAISSAVPGSCPPNWLHGKPTTEKPREANCSCSFSRAVYCGVSPHLEATFTTSSAEPGGTTEPTEESSPARVFTGISSMVTLPTVPGFRPIDPGSPAMVVTSEYTASSAGDSGPGDACGEASPLCTDSHAAPVPVQAAPEPAGRSCGSAAVVRILLIWVTVMCSTASLSHVEPILS